MLVEEQDSAFPGFLSPILRAGTAEGEAAMTRSTNVQHHRRPTVFWLIVKKGVGHEDTLTLDLDDEGKTLPVFCFEDEARMFLSLGMLGAGWQVRETTAGELISLLLGPCAGIRFVSLDPLPEMIHRRMVGLVSLRRKQFVESLIGGAKPREYPVAEGTESLVS